MRNTRLDHFFGVQQNRFGLNLTGKYMHCKPIVNYTTVCIQFILHVQREYRFCQFSKEGTDKDIHRV